MLFRSRSIHSNTTSISVQCYILSQLTSWLPHTTLSRTSWPHSTTINLADPTYFEPGPIDIILGADAYGSFIRPRIFRQPSGKLIAQETLFGWIILGPVSQRSPLPVTSVHASMNNDLLEILTKFWTLEEVPSKHSISSLLSPEELECEQHFVETHTRTPSGKHVVRLPLKSSVDLLGECRSLAERRMDHLIRRFD